MSETKTPGRMERENWYRWLCPVCGEPLTLAGSAREGLTWACPTPKLAGEHGIGPEFRHYEASRRLGDGPNPAIISLLDEVDGIIADLVGALERIFEADPQHMGEYMVAMKEGCAALQRAKEGM